MITTCIVIHNDDKILVLKPYFCFDLIMFLLYGNCFLTKNYICLFLDKPVDSINQIKKAGIKVLIKIAIIMLGQQPFK